MISRHNLQASPLPRSLLMRAELCATQLRLYDQSGHVQTHSTLPPPPFPCLSLLSVWYLSAFMFSFVIKSVILAARTWRTGGAVATDISMQMYALERAERVSSGKRNSQGNSHTQTLTHTHKPHRCRLSVCICTRLRFGCFWQPALCLIKNCCILLSAKWKWRPPQQPRVICKRECEFNCTHTLEAETSPVSSSPSSPSLSPPLVQLASTCSNRTVGKTCLSIIKWRHLSHSCRKKFSQRSALLAYFINLYFYFFFYSWNIAGAYLCRMRSAVAKSLASFACLLPSCPTSCHASRVPAI